VHGFQDVQGGVPRACPRPMIVDGHADVVFLHKLFNAGQILGRRVTGHHDSDSGSLQILKLAAHVVVGVGGKRDGSGGMQADSGGLVVGECLGSAVGSMGDDPSRPWRSGPGH